MANILCIDTSTSTTLVVLNHGKSVSFKSVLLTPHSQVILLLIDELLKERALELDSLDAIAYTKGPGSFTGLRLACAITQGLAAAVKKPVVGISSLAFIAYSALKNLSAKRCWVCLKGGYTGIYLACYSLDEQWKVHEQYIDLSESKIDNEKIDINEHDVYVGDGWLLLQEKHLSTTMLNYQSIQLVPSVLVRLAEQAFLQHQWLKPKDVQPHYLNQPKFKKQVNDHG